MQKQEDPLDDYMMLFWLILTGLICFLLGIALVLAIQRNVFSAQPNKLLPQMDAATAPLVQSDQPVAVQLPEVCVSSCSSWAEFALSIIPC